ncbi:MAG: Kazal-type serine protease inhibitor [Bradymonadaceae bacterium]
MDDSLERYAQIALGILGLSILACGGSNAPPDGELLDHFKPSSSAKRCKTTYTHRYGDCDKEGEFCVRGAHVDSADARPPETNCGNFENYDADEVEGHPNAGYCVEGVEDSAVENASSNKVCGCDRRVYPSPEAAHAAGASIDHYGTCDWGSQAQCGEDHGGCPTTEFCSYEPSSKCGTTAAGTCVKPPKECPTKSDPVCGCDGNTYKTECHAELAGVSDYHDGACDPNETIPMMAKPSPGEETSWSQRARLYPDVPFPETAEGTEIRGQMNGPTSESDNASIEGPDERAR